MNGFEEIYDDLAEVWSDDPDGGFIDQGEIDPKVFEKIRRLQEVKNE